jgi:xylulokinase
MNLEPGDCVVSLGTSDTMLMYLPIATPTTESHIMSHPTNPNAYMGMLCYKNGSLTREKIRDMYASGDWTVFNHLLDESPPGLTNGCQRRGFYYYMQEIIPFAKGFHRFENDKEVEEFTGDEEQVARYNVRAIIESQFMSMKVRTSRMLDTHGKSSDASQATKLKRILATGGAASNPHLLQVLSNVLNLPVYKKQGMNSASLGGALLAKFAIRRQSGYTNSFEQMMDDEQRDKVAHQLVAEPQATHAQVYDSMVDDFVRLEQLVVQNT